MSAPEPIVPQYSPPAELWLTLAHAFLPPMDRDTTQAFLSWLPEDLEELCAGTALDPAPEVAALEYSLAGIADPQALLAHYSGLFLAPPVKARLNFGYYLDRSLHGDSQDLIERILARHTARRREDFRDLSDHLAVLLELMALLGVEPDAAADRNALARDVLLVALPRLEQDLSLHAPRSPYLALARLTRRALETCTQGAGTRASPARRHARHDTTRGVWHACRGCGQPYAREKELRIVARALAERGLPADHLDLCPNCRGAQSGMAGRTAVP
jgi:TorA maturation chaperone TorD